MRSTQKPPPHPPQLSGLRLRHRRDSLFVVFSAVIVPGQSPTMEEAKAIIATQNQQHHHQCTCAIHAPNLSSNPASLSGYGVSPGEPASVSVDSCKCRDIPACVVCSPGTRTAEKESAEPVFGTESCCEDDGSKAV
ncbi:unnamed protein product [Closterium sp. NIES-65]|nr:unnamed protein product [Closterium sp. NIES-65]